MAVLRITLESFNAPAAVLQIGKHKIKMPLDWKMLIGEQGQPEISGTATELCLQFGYDDPNEFGTAINEVERKVSELGIDIERGRTAKKRLIKIYENQDSPYHPLQQNPPE